MALRTAGLAACMAGALALQGCAEDNFAGRAVSYNLASEQAHNSEMLLNIVRASQRRPLEFTAVQSITGSGGAGPQVALELPLAQNGDQQSTILRPQISAPGRPTFSVSVLDTQEFYQGILKPLTVQAFDLYLKRGLSRRLLLDLFFSKISVTVTTEGDRSRFNADFANDVADDQAFDDYQTLVEVLLKAGLTTTTSKAEPAVLGPPLTAEDVVRGGLGAKAATDGFALTPVGWCALRDGERRDMAVRLGDGAAAADDLTAACRGANNDADTALLQRLALPETLYRLEKPATGAAFGLCFQSSPVQRAGRREVSCQDVQRRAGGGSVLSLDLSQVAPKVCQTLNRHRTFGRPLDCSGDVAIGFGFAARSTYEVIRYLGEVTRRQTYPDDGRPRRTMAIKRDIPEADGDDDAPIPPICSANVAAGAVTTDGAECLPLFVVSTGHAAPGAVATARYAGHDYAIEAPPGGRSDRTPTLEAFQVISELFALNRSAKDLPSTAVFTVVGP